MRWKSLATPLEHERISGEIHYHPAVTLRTHFLTEDTKKYVFPNGRVCVASDVGPDPARDGFYWVSGLAGLGMSASYEIGRLAALSLVEGRTRPEFDPARL